MPSIEYKFNEKGEYVAVYEGVEFTHTSKSGEFLYKITSQKAPERFCHVVFARTKGAPWWRDSFILEKNLVKLEPPKPFWHKYKKDAKVLVRDCTGQRWEKAHYAGRCNGTGKPVVFVRNGSAWTSGEVTVPYLQIKDPKTGEEWVFGK